MMDDFHHICRKNNLTYVLFGGSALGAVRHSGFIPWDDDVDICMPRADYDYLAACYEKEFPQKYYVQNVKKCRKYDLNFTKIRLNNSSFCEFLDPEPERSGFFIDIFPAENVAGSFFGRKAQQLVSDGMLFICSCLRIFHKRRFLLELSKGHKEVRMAIDLKSLIAAPFSIVPFHNWLLLTEKALCGNRNSSSEYVAVPTGSGHFKRETYPRNWFFPPKIIEFEGRQFMAMGEVEKYLTRGFGDYMVLPPENERERHALQRFTMPY